MILLLFYNKASEIILQYKLSFNKSVLFKRSTELFVRRGRHYHKVEEETVREHFDIKD